MMNLIGIIVHRRLIRLSESMMQYRSQSRHSSVCRPCDRPSYLTNHDDTLCVAARDSVEF